MTMGFCRNRLFFLTGILLSFNVLATCLQTYGVQDLCNSTLKIKSPIFGVESSVLLKPTRNGSYEENRSCSLVVKPHLASCDLVVSIRNIDLRPSRIDTLTIKYYDGAERSKLYATTDSIRSLENEHYDSMENKSFKSSTNVTITFNTAEGAWNNSSFEGFELVITAVQRPPCASFHYSCESNVCIAQELRCDGHNHCGDRSDQRNCVGPLLRSDTGDTRLKFAYGFAIAMGIFITGFFIWFTFCNKCKGCCEGGGSYGSSYDRRDSYRGTYAIGAVTSYPSSSSSSYFGGGSSYTGGSAAGGYSASSSSYAGSSAAGCTSAY